jgi:cobalt/nickel transport system permease protein
MTASAGRVTSGHVGWLEKTLAEITASVERAVFTESYARRPGWLQQLDPRAKLGMFVALILSASMSTSFGILAALYLVILGAGRASKLPFDFFVKRVWLGMPFFAGVVILPSIFLVPGPRLFEVSIGALTLGPTIPGLAGAAVFILRVGVCVSLAVLLVLTTPWAELLRSLHALRVPQVFILILSMTYRYIFLFLHSVNGTFEARKSRTVGRPQGAEARRWISQSMAALLNRSFKMSNDVYAAMLARGFTGEVRTHSRHRMTPHDWIGLGGAVAVAGLVVLAGRIGG